MRQKRPSAPESPVALAMRVESPSSPASKASMSSGVAELRPVLKKDGRRKFGDEGVREIEIKIEALQPRKHVDLHLRKNLTAVRLKWMD